MVPKPITIDTASALFQEAAEELNFIRRMSEKQQLGHRFDRSYEDHLKDLAYTLEWAAKVPILPKQEER